MVYFANSNKPVVYSPKKSPFTIPNYSKYNQLQFKIQISAGGTSGSYVIPDGYNFFITACNLTGKTDVNAAGITFNISELDIDSSALGGATRSLLVAYTTINTPFSDTISFDNPVRVNQGEIILLRYGAVSVNTYSQANIFGYLEPIELQSLT